MMKKGEASLRGISLTSAGNILERRRIVIMTSFGRRREVLLDSLGTEFRSHADDSIENRDDGNAPGCNDAERNNADIRSDGENRDKPACDSGKGPRRSRYETSESSSVPHLCLFYRSSNRPLYGFPHTFNNNAVIDEALKLVESRHYEDITQDFAGHINVLM